jgi:Cu(I)/Ag(I) efflux system membrane protein CusA/SilA
MINRIIEWSLRNRFLVFCGVALLIGFGVRAVYRTPVDAIPDLSENQVVVFADWPGRSPQEVEDQVTYPLSVNLQGLAGVKTVRANSMFGFSLVTIIFDDKIDNYFARSRVLERLNYLGSTMPAGVTPMLGPDATGLGWVYQYYLDVDPKLAPDGGYDLGRLRAIQDWFVRYQLNAVPGVAEVASVGGFVRQYQIDVSSLRMRAMNVTMQMVMDAVKQSNLNVGGKVIEENGMEFVVRGVGLVNSNADLENIVLTQSSGTPVYLKDVATVQIGGDFRRGALDIGGHEAVGGIVVMRTGENAMQVIRDVKAKIAQISPSLPPGVSIKSFYDRSELIDRTLDTLKHALTEEAVLVTIVIILFLFHFRSILIVTLPLPLSILVSFILMNQFGITSNIMSLSGIAIAIGVLVDAGIVMAENAIRHCELAEKKKGARLNKAESLQVTLEAAQQVGRPIFFAMVIIIFAFIPVFALSGQEGKLFHPLAFTKTFAMARLDDSRHHARAGVVRDIHSRPVPFRGFKSADENTAGDLQSDSGLGVALPQNRARHRVDSGRRRAGSGLWGSARKLSQKLSTLNPQLAAKLPRGMGSEFMPTLNEGSLLFMPVLLPSTSLTEIKRIMAWQDQVISQTPEVASVGGKLGRSETATDPAPIEMIETTIMLKPESQWRPGMTKEKLVAELEEKLSQMPGYVPGFLQPIENRILMISTGIRAQVGIKILGDNLDDAAKKGVRGRARRPADSRRGRRGRVAHGRASRIWTSRWTARRWRVTACARRMSWIWSRVGHRRRQCFHRDCRARADSHSSPAATRRTRRHRTARRHFGADAGSGDRVPLGQVAKIHREIGPSEINSENGRLRVFVQANVEGRDLGGFVKETQARLAKEISLPPGMTIEWSGQYENQIRAQNTLRLIVPAALFVIFMLLYVVYHSARRRRTSSSPCRSR